MDNIFGGISLAAAIVSGYSLAIFVFFISKGANDADGIKSELNNGDFFPIALLTSTVAHGIAHDTLTSSAITGWAQYKQCREEYDRVIEIKE